MKDSLGTITVTAAMVADSIWTGYVNNVKVQRYCPVKEDDEIQVSGVEFNEGKLEDVEVTVQTPEGEEFAVFISRDELAQYDIDSLEESEAERAYESYYNSCAQNPNLRGDALRDFLAQDTLGMGGGE